MRALGRELGVTHGALYRYFPDLNAVLVALGADLTETMARASDDLPWRDWLRETASGIRQVIRAHPEIGSPMTWPVAVPAAHRLIRDGLTVLTRTFAVPDALVALDVVGRFADGFARAEVAAERARPPLPPELQSLLAELMLDSSQAYDFDAAFERELDIVLAGIEATLPKKP
jgi:AcrR family transcriptional regulator